MADHVDQDVVAGPRSNVRLDWRGASPGPVSSDSSRHRLDRRAETDESMRGDRGDAGTGPSECIRGRPRRRRYDSFLRAGAVGCSAPLPVAVARRVGGAVGRSRSGSGTTLEPWDSRHFAGWRGAVPPLTLEWQRRGVAVGPRRPIRPSGRAWAASQTTPGRPPPPSRRVSRSDE